ncbi:MAG TPA: hypothetical protein PLY87_30155 [Planctomycetaceae bacterium]|nr:hypothetical protein [Planctomycetaceae bacterium]
MQLNLGTGAYAGGQRHQLQTFEHLFKIVDRMPESASIESYYLSFFAAHTITDGAGNFTLKSEVKDLAFTDELATLLGEKFASGTSQQRLFVTALLSDPE